MITKKLFEKCFYDCQYEKACQGKTDVTVLVELYDKEYVIREYEDRGWELFDVKKELVNHGRK